MREFFILLVLLRSLLDYSVFCATFSPCVDSCGNKTSMYGTLELCAEKQWCQMIFYNPSIDEKQINKATFVKVFPDETIYGENMEINFIEVRAFWNLPSLKYIYLAFNEIKEVQYGIFSHLPVIFLDLSWNKINYVGETSLTEMDNLLTLNLSHNELVMLDLKDYSLPLQTLIASHNFLENFETYDKHITTLDLSFNKLTYFPPLRTYKKVDLTK